MRHSCEILTCLTCSAGCKGPVNPGPTGPVASVSTSKLLQVVLTSILPADATPRADADGIGPPTLTQLVGNNDWLRRRPLFLTPTRSEAT